MSGFLTDTRIRTLQVLGKQRAPMMTEEIINFSIQAYSFLLPLAGIGLVIVILVLGPLSLFQRTRSIAGSGVYCFSWLLGITTWFLGCILTFTTWGWPALFLGLLVGGVGVVPIAVLASFFAIKDLSMGFSLIVMVVLTIATRVGGQILINQSNSATR